MNLLKTMNELPNRARRAQKVGLVLAALVFLFGLTSPARAQSGGGTGKVVVVDHRFVSTVGVAREQMLRITVPIQNNQNRTGHTRVIFGTDQAVWMGHVKVFNGLTGAEIRSFDLRNPSAGLHTFDIGGSGDDILVGGDNAGTDRVQLWVEVKLVVRYDPRTIEPDDVIFPPTFEVVDKSSGRTTVHSPLKKVGAGTLVLANANTYN
jgi:hypothetical protein